MDRDTLIAEIVAKLRELSDDIIHHLHRIIMRL